MPYVRVPKLYFSPNGAASWVTPWLDRAAFQTLSWTIAWTADAANNFALSVEGTDDSTQVNDTTFAAAATVVTMTVPAADIHGTGLAVAAAAGKSVIITKAFPAYERIKGTRTGGNANLVFTIWVSGREH